jgi:uroporphyrinogen III methyltransferase/synthase
MNSTAPKGFVSLVGAGPGDPGLLTLAGRDRLVAADVVIYDRLIGGAILDHVGPKAERIFAGKEASRHALSQGQINDLLVAKAREGKRVVRLKGGDPFVFGRGGEEALALVAAGVPFEVIPGVTSAVAAPAYAGVPVTHRGLASSFAVVTGHEDDTKDEASVNWARLATAVDTIVVLMGGAALAGVAKALIAGGRPSETPAVSIEWGTTPQQRTVSSSLGGIATAVKSAGLGTPLLTVIGEVVSLQDKIAWFGRGALAGKRVLVTRTRDQASALSDLLRRAGAVPIELPTLELEVVASEAELDAAARRLAARTYAWCLFTSPNAIDHFFEYLQRTNRDARVFGICRIAALGSATATALRSRGLIADLVASEFTSSGLLESLPSELAGQRVLLPTAEGANPALATGLRSRGAEVEELRLYQSVVPKTVDAEVLQLVREGRLDIATFASSSAVRNLATLLGEDFKRLNDGAVACIGPVTAATARELGLRVDIEPVTHTILALVESLKAYFPLLTL